MSTDLSQRSTYTVALTYIVALIDRTGSMNKIKRDTEGAFDAFITEQRELTRELHDEVCMTMIQFDADSMRKPQIDIIYQDLPIECVPPLILEPRGWTPLSDAIAYTIHNTEIALKAIPITQQPSNIIIVITTDGEENSSREFPGHGGVQQVARMVREKQAQGWQFIFIGAGIDAFKAAGGYGVPRGDTISVAASAQGVTEAYTQVTDSVTRFRTATSSGTPWEKSGSKPWEKKKGE